jgi:photosystem II stability/assembly factor-like uncharacterized protein
MPRIPFRTSSLLCLCFVFVSGLLGLPGYAAEPLLFDSKLLDNLPLRCLGPANMGGRITDLAVVESKPAVMFVAAASGGLWKTVNNGVTWKPVFDRQDTASIGAVAVAPSNPDIVWVGTGEANARNSVSWGTGVYKSTDGGETWHNMGLNDTHHIGRIVVHPNNPDMVYVAALGHLWAPNRERGVYKTVDGGRTWQLVYGINQDTGFIDLAMDPSDPAILYAAAYQVRRDAFSGGNPAVLYGPGSGLFKTADAGKTWVKLSGGLPARPLGRIGIDVCRKDLRIVYAVIQTDKTDIRTVPGQLAKTGNNPETGGVFRSLDKGETWTKLNDLCPRPFYYGQIRIDPNDVQRIYVLGISLYVSNDGGRTFQNTGARGVHADHHALWIDPRDSEHMVLGGDGGLAFSYDRGATWEHLNNLPIGQFYAVTVDLRKPYWIYGGLQDNGTWAGPSATRRAGGIANADWIRITGGDGFYCQVDPEAPHLVYAESQYGGLRRFNLQNGEAREIRPLPPKGQPAFRFNWSSPILLSPHNPRTLFFGGNYLFRSLDRGDHWEAISPDLTRGKLDPSSNLAHTITTIAESPLKPGLLYVGTDDGLIHLSRNGGGTWTDLTAAFHPSPPGGRDIPSDGGTGVSPVGPTGGTPIPLRVPVGWVSRLECSHFVEGLAYLTIDRHRNDDRAPYIFKTTDFGKTWQGLAADPLASPPPLPALPPPVGEGTGGGLGWGPAYVIREDPRNKDLLFLGTESGLFISIDGGNHWQRFPKLPIVPVHDLVIHPRDRELVIGTHGRGIYLLDIAPLEEMTAETIKLDAYMFEIRPALAFRFRGSRGETGSKSFTAPNPPFGATIYYYLKGSISESAQITILDALGRTVAQLSGEKTAGLHSSTWDLQPSAKGKPTRPGGMVPAGDYVAVLKAGSQTIKKKFLVEAEE